MLRYENIASKGKKIIDVTVVIPCYRCADTIYRTVESVWQQTCLPREVILIEDCSGDLGVTKSALLELEKNYPEGWIQIIFLTRNEGPGHGRNVGWENAIGKYIAFLDSDDAWHPQKLEIQYLFMKRRKWVSICAHEYTKYAPEHEAKRLNRQVKAKEIKLRHMFLSNRFPTRTVMLKRNLWNRFDNNMYIGEDLLLWCDILATGKRGVVLEAQLAYVFDDVRETLTSNLKKTEMGELTAYKKIWKKGYIGTLQYGICSTFSYIKYLRRKIIGRKNKKEANHIVTES